MCLDSDLIPTVLSVAGHWGKNVWANYTPQRANFSLLLRYRKITPISYHTFSLGTWALLAVIAFKASQAFLLTKKLDPRRRWSTSSRVKCDKSSSVKPSSEKEIVNQGWANFMGAGGDDEVFFMWPFLARQRNRKVMFLVPIHAHTSRRAYNCFIFCF
jgi:hypothetical protein